jgi:hypothetical protein
MTGATLLAFAGAMFGIAYSALGFIALKYLNNASETDRVVGWSLWWFTEADRYTSKGKRLCVLGGIAFACGIACWVGWYAARN